MTRQTAIAALLLAVLTTSTGCGGAQPSSTVARQSSSKCAPAGGFGGANEQKVPTTFPKDFPVYPGAKFAAGYHSPQMVSATWTSPATKKALRDFYEKQLQSGDWQLFGIQYSDPCDAYWHVERRSDTHYGGFLSAYTGPATGGASFISVNLGKK
jgi:hypothetical protein